LGIVFEERGDDSFERLVVLDSGVLSVGVLLGVLVSSIGGDFLGDLVGDADLHALGIGEQPAELVIERTPLKSTCWSSSRSFT
jgi:hypothetical protein